MPLARPLTTLQHYFSALRVMYCALLLAIAAHSLFAQSPTVHGSVVDSSGAPVAGATVTVTNKGTGIATRATTDDNGQFSMSLAGSGDYSLAAEAKGFEVARVEDLRLELNTSREVDLKLVPQEIKQSVTVTAETAESKALESSPTEAPLNALQPTSEVTKTYIAENIPVTYNYDAIVAMAPSVVTTSPGGPATDGNIYIRGFKDTQYNVTFDGIPFRNYSLNHRSSIYFTSNDLGEVSIDRGPGTASTVGDETFGGTLSLQSQTPYQQLEITPTVAFGSFSSQLYGLQVDSGAIQALNGASAMIDLQHTSTSGYLTNESAHRTNLFFKGQQPLGHSTVLTFVATYDTSFKNYPWGASKAQIAEYGADYGYSTNPNSQSYYAYNTNPFRTTFDYVGIQSQFGNGWSLDNKAYTYSLMQDPFFAGLDVSGNTKNGTPYSSTDVPGTKYSTQLRSFGDVLAVKKRTPFGDLKFGVWGDHQLGHRTATDVDLTLSGMPYPTNATVYRQALTLDTIEPYVEFDWKPLQALTITPGLKYDVVSRGNDAIVNQGTGKPANLSDSWNKPLPSISLNYKLSAGWAAYAQVAEGFLAPPYNVQFTSIQSPIQPQITWNYQLGSSWRSRRWTLSGDLYYINFKNMLGSVNVGGITEFYSAGGVIYKGIEAETTFYIGKGFSFYGNGSINRAKNKQTQQWIAEAPNGTAGSGIIYNQHGWYGSFLDKWVGDRYGDTGQKQALSPFNQLDFSFGYTLRERPKGMPTLQLKLQVMNLLNSTKIDDFAGYSGGSSTPLFYTLLRRSYVATVSVPF